MHHLQQPASFKCIFFLSAIQMHRPPHPSGIDRDVLIRARLVSLRLQTDLYKLWKVCSNHLAIKIICTPPSDVFWRTDFANYWENKAVEGFLEGKTVWTIKKKKQKTNSLNFKCAQFINSVNKAKYYLHGSGPSPTVFCA